MTSLSKKPVAKKRGRPVGSKNKPKKIILSRTEVDLASKLGVTPVQLAKEKLKLTKKRKPAAASKTFKQSDTDAAVHRLMDANLSLIKDNNQLLKVINNLEHQIIGFRAVISYLENQAGLRNTQ